MLPVSLRPSGRLLSDATVLVQRRSERKFEYGRWRSNILIYHLRYSLRPFDAREDYALASNAESCREQVSSHHFPS